MNKVTDKIGLLNRVTLESLNEPGRLKIVRNFTETSIKMLGADFGFAWWRSSVGSDYQLAYKSKNISYEPNQPRKHGGNYLAQKKGQPVFVEDTSKQKYEKEYDVRPYMKSYAIIPIAFDGKFYGNIVLCYKKKRNFSQEDRSMCAALGSSMAQAMTINRLYSNLTDFKRTLDNTLDSIFIINPNNGKVTYANQGAAMLTGRKLKDLVRSNFYEVIDGLSETELRKRMNEIRENDNLQYLVFDSTIKGHKKTQWPVEISLQHVVQKDQPERFLAIVRDITERKQSEDTIRQMAYFDPLTQLPNRILFNERIRQELEHVESHKGMFAVFFLDLDRFKVINDIYGHQIGDELLIAVANRLQRSLPRKATLCRMGGDEFMVLLPRLKDVKEAINCAKIIKDAFVEYFQLEDQEVYVNSSVGLAIYPLDGGDIRTVMKHADLALHRAKEQGGNSYQQYNEGLPIFYSMQPQLEKQLRKAIKNNELVIHYQPVVSVNNKKIMYCEALVRWNHPEMGLLYPDSFIGPAEESGLIVEMGDWIVNEVARQIQQWRNEKRKVVPVSINVSPRQLLNPNFVYRIQNAFENHNVKIADVKLELTETFLMKNIDMSVGILEQLKLLGLRILIDDFGTGYASLNYLKRLPIDGVKIDKTFVQGSAGNLQDAALTSAIISIAHQLNLEAVAEGVENEQQLLLLREHKCNFAQGNLFYKPMPGIEFGKLLEGKR